jgi:hypothetical protein
MCADQPVPNASFFSRSRPSLIPLVWAAAWVTLFAVALYRISWPFVDVYNMLTEASLYDWPATFANAFGPDAEYRPLFRLAIKASYEVFGLRVWPYQTLVLLQFASVLALLIWLSRPVGVRRAVAACVALSCIAGLHTSRILFGFWPVNAGSFVLILLLAAIALAVEPRTRSIGWVFFPLVLVGLLSLEWGVLLVVVLPVLWMMKAPAVDRRALMWAFAGVAAYAAIRFAFGWVSVSPSFHTESGFGFSELEPAELQERFGRAPWLFWLYNVGATFLTVVLSEPRSGMFMFVASLMEGNVPYWRWIHLGSSLLTTAAIAATLAVYRPSSARDRLLCAAGLAMLVFGSAFGLPYTRDRVGLMAGIGYGLLLYVACATLLERLPATGWRRWMVTSGLVIIGALWGVRGAETYFQLHDTAWDFHHEWDERAADFDSPELQPPLLTRLRRAALRTTPEDPRLDPTWTFVLFERRFPINASRPLSPPFDIRWRPGVSEAGRRGLEAELGLTDAQQVLRDPRQRTWAYRMRRPTRERVRAILMNAAVEDTARIDLERFEIVD